MCRSASGEKILVDLFLCARRFIPPHQSLTRQLPPEGKPSLLCANMANIYVVACLCDPLVALLCSAKGLLQKGFPLGGSCRVSD